MHRAGYFVKQKRFLKNFVGDRRRFASFLWVDLSHKRHESGNRPYRYDQDHYRLRCIEKKTKKAEIRAFSYDQEAR